MFSPSLIGQGHVPLKNPKQLPVAFVTQSNRHKVNIKPPYCILLSFTIRRSRIQLPVPHFRPKNQLNSKPRCCFLYFFFPEKLSDPEIKMDIKRQRVFFSRETPIYNLARWRNCSKELIAGRTNSCQHCCKQQVPQLQGSFQ